MNEPIIIAIACIVLIAILCQWFAWWVKLPAILFLLIVGIIIGPVTGWLNPDKLFGHLLYPLISLSVAVILFEGSLTLKFGELQDLRGVIRNLITFGLLITVIATAILAHLILDFSWQFAALLGVITAVTGPTVITPLLRAVRPTTQISNILRWEGIMIDPLGALLAVLVYGFITTLRDHHALLHSIYAFSELIVIGTLLGIMAGYALGVTLRNHWLPEFLHNITTLALVLAVFALANLIDDGSGLLAVTIMGIWLTNMRQVPVDDILGFKESLSLLLISGLFIILASRIHLNHIQDIIWQGLLFFLLLQFVVRPLSIFLCAMRSSLSTRERLFLSWISPRGIVAAAVAAIFTYRLRRYGYSNADYLVLMTFIIILTTVIFQSATARLVAKLLGVAEPEPKGILIIGANQVARSIGACLQENGFRVLLASASWDYTQAARMQGLPVYFGNPISDHADRHLDLVGIGKVLALTAQSDLNTLTSLRYRREFGRQAIYTIQCDYKATDKYNPAARFEGMHLFAKNATFATIADALDQGAIIRSTLLTNNFTLDQYLKQYANRALPLFALDSKKNRLHIFTIEHDLVLAPGWTIISLISPDTTPQDPA